MSDSTDPSRRTLLNSVSSTDSQSASGSDDVYSAERRSFIKRMGVTLGAIPIGAANISGAAAANPFDSSDDVSVETTEVGRPERNHVARDARKTDEFADVADVLNVPRRATDVVHYHVEIDGEVHEGYRVTFGETPDGDASVGAGSSFINVYLSETFDSGARAIGKEEVGGGVRSAASDQNGVFDLGTTRASEVAEQVFGEGDQVAAASDEELNTDDAVLGYSDRVEDAGGVLIVPVEQNGEIVDRVTAQLESPLSAPTAVSTTRPDGVSAMGHIVCDPTGYVCHNYCKSLCATLAGLAAGACYAKCTATIAGIPIAPACGAVCAGVVGGSCYKACTSEVH